jgi:type III restriction enzyme
MDSGWEAKLGQVLDGMEEVVAYVKNQGLNFRIPYTFEGEAANYVTDLIVRYDDGGVEPLNLIIEVTGEHRREKAAKVAIAETYWIPAVNNHGGLGRWSFLEVSDPWDAAHQIRAHVAALAPTKALA